METTYNIAIPDGHITFIYSLFYHLGIWKTEDGITIRQRVFFFYFVSVIVSIFFGAFFTSDGDEIVYLIVTTFVGVVQISRMECLIRKQKGIISLTRGTGTYSTNDYDVYTDAVNKIRNVNTLAQLFMYVVIFALIAVVLLPVTSSENQIIFNVAFPIDYNASPGAFWVVYAFVTFGFFLSAVCCSYVVVVWHLMLNFIVKYEVLGSQLRHLGMGNVGEERKVRRSLLTIARNGLYLKQLVEAIKNHQKTYGIVEEFASTFSNSFLLQIVSSSVCICGSIYTLAFSNHDNLVQDTFYCAILFYSFVDTFMLMYLGNEIKLSSDKLSFRLYESNWIEQTESCKIYVLIFVERLKLPQELRIGKLFPLNMESFGLIVKRAYSMFNILQNLRQ